MSSAQKGLLGLVGLLVLLMFAGLLCGPGDDGEVATSGTSGTAAEVGETRRLDGPPQGTKAAVRPEGDGEVYQLDVYVTGPDGEAVVGARASLLPTGGEDRGAAASASAGNGGRARLEGIPAGRFQLVVTAGGFMTSPPIEVRLPEEHRREIPVRLARAARIEGSMFLLDGTAAISGVVRVRSTSGGERIFHLEPDERGSFQSGGIDPGVWEISWVPASDQPADSRMILVRPIGEGELVRVELTLPKAVAETAPGRRIGIVDLD